jgi:hypothetical protein
MIANADEIAPGPNDIFNDAGVDDRIGIERRIASFAAIRPAADSGGLEPTRPPAPMNHHRAPSMLSPEKAPLHFEVADGIGRFRPQGTFNLSEAVSLITDVIAFCRERRVKRLFVDVTGIQGAAIPTLVDRFLMAEEWAHESRGLVAAAMVAPAEYIHPQKFGVRVANDLGMAADVFLSETEAMKWLSAQPDRG